MPNFSIPTSALNALDVVIETTANNIANVSTDG
ncbi:flagellar basal body protein, partial [Desulfovibrio sp. OttesenSCG-928-F20]|nr:flagellar basal body protein [Desulfovibrio sp. OttesenSCG-928-F20]